MEGLPAYARPRHAHRLVAALAPLALLAVPAAATAVDVGQPVTAGPKTPAAVATALKAHRPVIAAFLMPGVAEDDAVLASLAEARRSEPALRSAQVFIYRVAPGGHAAFGDLATLLGIESTPAVAVIAPNGTLTNRFHGYVDGAILRQALVSANRKGGGTKAQAPKPKPSPEPSGKPAPAPKPAPSPKPNPPSRGQDGATGDAAGIALARTVNARMMAAPGLRVVSVVNVAKGVQHRVQATLRGQDVHIQGTVGTGRVEAVVLGGTNYGKDPARGCWRAVSTQTEMVQPQIKLDGSRVMGPRRRGHLTTIEVRDRAASASIVYRIDARSNMLTGARIRIRGSAQGGGFTVRAFARPPHIVSPTTNLCPVARAAPDPNANS